MYGIREPLAEGIPGYVPADGYLPGLARPVRKDTWNPRQPRWTPFAGCERVSLTAEVYNRDVVFRFGSKARSLRQRLIQLKKAPHRGTISHFSKDSSRRLQRLVRNTADMWSAFVTLTYPGEFPCNGRESKKHLHAFLQFLRRKKISYVWILEFQRRGAPHYHFLVSGYVDKTELARRWYEIVGSGFEGHLKAGTRVEGVKNPDQVGAYMSAYMAKLEQKEVPWGYVNVGRFWGASRCLTKVLYRMDGLYSQAVEALSDPVKFYQGKCASWGFRWEWKGEGFWLRDGADFFRDLLRQSVRMDEGYEPIIDENGCKWLIKKFPDNTFDIKKVGWDWKETDGNPVEEKYVAPVERLAMQGQYLLDGSSETGMAERFREFKARVAAEEKVWRDGVEVPLTLEDFDFAMNEARG